MWKPQKAEPRAEVRSASPWQSLAHGSESRGLHSLSLRVEKLNMEDKEEDPHHRKFHRRAWAKAIMLWTCSPPTELECNEWSSPCGRKLRRTPWDRTDSKWIWAKGAKEAVTGTEQRGQKAGAIHKMWAKENQNFHHPTALPWNPRFLKHCHCSALAAVPPTLPQGHNLLSHQLQWCQSAQPWVMGTNVTKRWQQDHGEVGWKYFCYQDATREREVKSERTYKYGAGEIFQAYKLSEVV